MVTESYSGGNIIVHHSEDHDLHDLDLAQDPYAESSTFKFVAQYATNVWPGHHPLRIKHYFYDVLIWRMGCFYFVAWLTGYGLADIHDCEAQHTAFGVTVEECTELVFRSEIATWISSVLILIVILVIQFIPIRQTGLIPVVSLFRPRTMIVGLMVGSTFGLLDIIDATCCGNLLPSLLVRGREVYVDWDLRKVVVKESQVSSPRRSSRKSTSSSRKSRRSTEKRDRGIYDIPSEI
eukprot:Clim_evm2s92 gene=Clim_evmTU2s92